MRALNEIRARLGMTREEAAQHAITEMAAYERKRSGLAAEARQLMQDPAYGTETRDVASLMEELLDLT